MQLRLLGTGSPNPFPDRLGPAVLLSCEGDHLLIDAGRGVTTQLIRAGVAPEELAALLITHHHYDHIGNLADLLLTAWHGGSRHVPIFGPPGTEQIVNNLFDHVYHRELTFAHAFARTIATPIPDVRDVVSVTDIIRGRIYRLGEWQVKAVAVDHGERLGLTYEEWPCLAYRIERNGKSVVVSGDTVACDNLITLAHGADVLVQCCFLADAYVDTPARRLLAELVIATSGQVGKIATQAAVKALVLTHFGDTDPEMLAAIKADVRRDFHGPTFLGTDLFGMEV